MLKFLTKKLVTAYQAKRLAKEDLRRKERNRKQIALILEGIEQRGY